MAKRGALTVPDASVPAVLICTLMSAAGMRTSAIDTLRLSGGERPSHIPVVGDEDNVEKVAHVGVVVLMVSQVFQWLVALQ